MLEQPKGKTKSQERLKVALKFIVVMALLAAGFKLFIFNSNSGQINDETKHKDAGISREDFAKCLNEKGLIMYGVDTCEFCLAQKKMFGSAFEKINYINCYFDKDKCATEGVTGYPLWVIGERRVSGIQKFTNLAALTGCTEPTEESSLPK